MADVVCTPPRTSREWRDATNSTNRPVIVTAAIYSESDRHGGSFSVHANSTTPSRRLIAGVQGLARRSPGLAIRAASTVHLITDLVLDRETIHAACQAWRATLPLAALHLHRVAPRKLPGMELRWKHAADVLARVEWKCAFLIDLTDVSVLHLPACSAMAPRVHMASDFCVGGQRVRNLLHGAWDANKPALDALSLGWRTALSAWLTTGRAPSNAYALTMNCGVVGGPRAALEPELRSVVAWLESNWKGTEVRNEAYSDMLAWNAVALRLASGASVVSGYPLGPVSHPMQGVLCSGHGRDATRNCGTFGLSLIHI